MTIPEIDRCVTDMTVLYDTREQDTAALRKRLTAMPCPTRREKLDSGDYSCETILPDGKVYSLKSKFAIERKMSLGEICGNFCRGRGRFKHEFDRFRNNGGILCIVIENANLRHLRAHKYNSQMSPASLMASLSAWYAEYDAPFYFCDRDDTGYLIYNLLKYQLREHLRREFGDAKE